MPQDFLASLSSRTTGATGVGPERPDGTPLSAPAAEVAAFSALIAPAKASQGGAAGSALATAPGGDGTGAPDDPLAALLSALPPEGDGAAPGAALPDWLRAALLGSAQGAPGDIDGVTGAGAAAAPATDRASSQGEAARTGVAARSVDPATVASGGATIVGNVSEAGSADTAEAGALPMEPADPMDPGLGGGPEDGPQGDPPGGLQGRTAAGGSATGAGGSAVVAATATPSGAGAAANPPPAGPIDTKRGRAGAAEERARVPAARAATDGAPMVQAASASESRSGRTQDATASHARAAAEFVPAASTPETPDMPDIRPAASVAAGEDRPVAPAPASSPGPAPAPGPVATADATAPTAAGAAADALSPATEPPRPAVPAPPVALPQLRDAMSERVRAMAEEAGDDTVRLRTATGTAEVELAPAELGRLRLQLSTTERGLHLTVLVDRPESVDAVRRHLDGLHRSLMAEGVTLDGFDIGTGGGAGARGQEQTAGQGRPGQDASRTASGAPAAQAAADAPPPAPGRTATGRLDIRI